MKNLYLLAAGLLTGLAVPTSTLPQVLLSQLETHSQEIEPITSHSIASPVQVSLPEFSNQGLSLPTQSSWQPSYEQLIPPPPASGNQLYYQRLAALKAGQIYTRLGDSNSQSSSVSANKRQLTYEDWKNLLELEGSAMADGQGKNRLSILVGDSLSMWFPKEKLPVGELWLNQGISGDTSTGILKRLSAFSQTRPEVIYLMAGINDLLKGGTDREILYNHRQIIRRLRRTHPQTQIIVESILPTRLSLALNNRIRNLNQQLNQVAKQEGANFLNLYDFFIDDQGKLRQDLTTDGLHLKPAGYTVWYSALDQVESKLALSKISSKTNKPEEVKN